MTRLSPSPVQKEKKDETFIYRIVRIPFLHYQHRHRRCRCLHLYTFSSDLRNFLLTKVLDLSMTFINVIINIIIDCN